VDIIDLVAIENIKCFLEMSDFKLTQETYSWGFNATCEGNIDTVAHNAGQKVGLLKIQDYKSNIWMLMRIELNCTCAYCVERRTVQTT